MDRMITITVDHYDRETEIDITKAKSGLDHRSASIIVDIVREFRRLGYPEPPPHRALVHQPGQDLGPSRRQVREPGDAVFRETCRDVLRTDTIKITRDGDRVGSDWLDEIVRRICASAGKENGKSGNATNGSVAKSNVVIGNGTHANGTTTNGTNGHRKTLGGGRIRGKRA